jgi:hypothetical protein
MQHMRHLSHAEFALIRYRQEHDRVWRYLGLGWQIRTHYDHAGARVSEVKSHGKPWRRKGNLASTRSQAR